MSRSAVTAALLALSTIGAAPAPSMTDGDRLLEEFKAICLDFDGAMDLAEEVALERGYRHAPEEVPDDLFQRGGLYVYSKDADGAHWRVVLKRNRIHWGGGVETESTTARFIRCSVSADPAHFGSARRAVGRYTSLRSFAQRNTTVFAWIPTPGGQRRAVTRPAFDGHLQRLLDEDGMRAILVAKHGQQVIMTLMTPAEPTI